jgi:hypothetical protein
MTGLDARHDGRYCNRMNVNVPAPGLVRDHPGREFLTCDTHQRTGNRA